MKRVHPVSFRLGYNIPWKDALNILPNYFSCTFLLYISLFLYYLLRKLKFWGHVIHISILRVVLTDKINCFFQYFFALFKLRYFKSRLYFKPRRILHRKSLLPQILVSFFYRLAYYLWLVKGWITYFFPFNIFSLIFFRQWSHYLTFKEFFIEYRKFTKLFMLLNFAFYQKDIQLLSYVFHQVLRKNKKHFRSLNWIFTIIQYMLTFHPNVSGLLVRISGRFNNQTKAQTKNFAVGRAMKLNTLDSVFRYNSSFCITPIGVFGVKLWFY